MPTSDPRHTVRSLIEPAVQRMGFDLVAVEWVAAGAGSVLRLSIDRPAGVTARACVEVSHEVSPLLDEADPIRGRYTLEVSSPGIERPVQRLSDFERFGGYRVKLRLIEGFPRRRYTGVLAGVEGEEVRVEVDGQEQRFHVDSIDRAHLVLSLDEYQGLGEALPDAGVAQENEE